MGRDGQTRAAWKFLYTHTTRTHARTRARASAIKMRFFRRSVKKTCEKDVAEDEAMYRTALQKTAGHQGQASICTSEHELQKEAVAKGCGDSEVEGAASTGTGDGQENCTSEH